jgi:hypothetical protein
MSTIRLRALRGIDRDKSVQRALLRSRRTHNRLCTRRQSLPDQQESVELTPSKHASGVETARMHKKNKKPLRRKIIFPDDEMKAEEIDQEPISNEQASLFDSQ